MTIIGKNLKFCLAIKILLILFCTLKTWESFLTPITHTFSHLVVEDDEDDFPAMRSDGDFSHNSSSSKEKCKCVNFFTENLYEWYYKPDTRWVFMFFSKQKMTGIVI